MSVSSLTTCLMNKWMNKGASFYIALSAMVLFTASAATVVTYNQAEQKILVATQDKIEEDAQASIKLSSVSKLLKSRDDITDDFINEVESVTGVNIIGRDNNIYEVSYQATTTEEYVTYINSTFIEEPLLSYLRIPILDGEDIPRDLYPEEMAYKYLSNIINPLLSEDWLYHKINTDYDGNREIDNLVNIVEDLSDSGELFTQIGHHEFESMNQIHITENTFVEGNVNFDGKEDLELIVDPGVILVIDGKLEVNDNVLLDGAIMSNDDISFKNNHSQVNGILFADNDIEFYYDVSFSQLYSHPTFVVAADRVTFKNDASGYAYIFSKQIDKHSRTQLDLIGGAYVLDETAAWLYEFFDSLIPNTGIELSDFEALGFVISSFDGLTSSQSIFSRALVGFEDFPDELLPTIQVYNLLSSIIDPIEGQGTHELQDIDKQVKDVGDLADDELIFVELDERDLEDEYVVNITENTYIKGDIHIDHRDYSGTIQLNIAEDAVLVIDGKFECRENLDFNGIMIVSNDIELKGDSNNIVGTMFSGDDILIDDDISVQLSDDYTTPTFLVAENDFKLQRDTTLEYAGYIIAKHLNIEDEGRTTIDLVGGIYIYDDPIDELDNMIYNVIGNVVVNPNITTESLTVHGITYEVIKLSDSGYVPTIVRNIS